MFSKIEIINANNHHKIGEKIQRYQIFFKFSLFCHLLYKLFSKITQTNAYHIVCIFYIIMHSKIIENFKL